MPTSPQRAPCRMIEFRRHVWKIIRQIVTTSTIKSLYPRTKRRYRAAWRLTECYIISPNLWYLSFGCTVCTFSTSANHRRCHSHECSSARTEHTSLTPIWGVRRISKCERYCEMLHVTNIRTAFTRCAFPVPRNPHWTDLVALNRKLIVSQLECTFASSWPVLSQWMQLRNCNLVGYHALSWYNRRTLSLYWMWLWSRHGRILVYSRSHLIGVSCHLIRNKPYYIMNRLLPFHIRL